jgi:hypothetical protein
MKGGDQGSVWHQLLQGVHGLQGCPHASGQRDHRVLQGRANNEMDHRVLQVELEQYGSLSTSRSTVVLQEELIIGLFIECFKVVLVAGLIIECFKVELATGQII